MHVYTLVRSLVKSPSTVRTLKRTSAQLCVSAKPCNPALPQQSWRMHSKCLEKAISLLHLCWLPDRLHLSPQTLLGHSCPILLLFPVNSKMYPLLNVTTGHTADSPRLSGQAPMNSNALAFSLSPHKHPSLHICQPRFPFPSQTPGAPTKPHLTLSGQIHAPRTYPPAALRGQYHIPAEPSQCRLICPHHRQHGRPRFHSRPSPATVC